MLKTRVIPLLLLHNGGLVKTVKFKNPKYVGDPINAIRIFNEKEVDELIFLDIDASREGREPDYDLIRDFASECFMPVCYGGGITSVEQIKKIFSLGIEKVSLNATVLENLSLVSEAAKLFGSQSIVVSVDVKKTLMGKYRVYDHIRKKGISLSLERYISDIEEAGAGEILVNSVDRDGTFEGYDIQLMKMVVESTTLPVIACGGAASMEDFRRV